MVGDGSKKKGKNNQNTSEIAEYLQKKRKREALKSKRHRVCSSS